MIANYQHTLSCDSTTTAKRSCVTFTETYDSAAIRFTATIQNVIMAVVRDMFAKNNSERYLSEQVMQASENSFAEIWDEPEEDIWDKL